MKFIKITLLSIILGLAFSSNTQAQNNFLHFDGVDDYIGFPFNHPETNFTYEVWFKTAKTLQGISSARQGGPAVRNNDRNLFLDAGGNLCYRIWKYELIKTSGQNYADDNWHHVAVVVENGVGQRMYVDGQLEATGIKSSSNFTSDNYFQIGLSGHFGFNGDAGIPWIQDDPASGTYFSGLLDELRLWNVVRTEAQIKSNRKKEIILPNPDLLLYFNFNQGIGGRNNSALAAPEVKNMAGGNSGPLINFAEVGCTSNFVSYSSCGYAFIWSDIPTLSEWGLIFLFLSFLSFGAAWMYQRKKIFAEN